MGSRLMICKASFAVSEKVPFAFFRELPKTILYLYPITQSQKAQSPDGWTRRRTRLKVEWMLDGHVERRKEVNS